jgi:hypothetical protein
MVYLLPNIPEHLSRAICASLIAILPTPANVTPEQIALRDERAITALAHYIPMNAAEGELPSISSPPSSAPRTRCTRPRSISTIPPPSIAAAASTA